MKEHALQRLGNRAAAALILALALLAPAAAPGQPANYARPFEPPTRPALIPLPPGTVEPQGWLRDWCLAARNGYTGHMDEYDDEFKRAWAANHKMTGEGLFWYKGGWPYEGGGYWFDGLGRLGYALHDEALIQQAQRRLYAVADHMNTNGLLFLWWLDRNNPGDRKAVTAALDGWPLWACGLLGRSMTGFYAGSRDKHILEALEKAYGADPDCLRWITGNMSNPWPAFDTYSWTGNKGIADALDAMFKKEGGALLPSLSRYRKAPDLKPGTTVNNEHVVGFIEATTPWAVGYLWTGDKSYLEAAVGWHDLRGPHRDAASWRAGFGRMVRTHRSLPGQRDLRRGGVCLEPGLPALRHRGGADGRPAGAGLLQCGAGHGRARFQNACLFPEPEPVDNRVSGFSARAESRRRIVPAQAQPAVLHGRAQPGGAVLRDAHVDGHL